MSQTGKGLTLVASACLLVIVPSCKHGGRAGPEVPPARTKPASRTNEAAAVAAKAAAIINRVKQRYREFGFVLEPSFPGLHQGTGVSPYSLRDLKTGQHLRTGLGFHDTDVELFLKISSRFTARSVYIIGNAFGYSTFCLAEIFEGAIVDAIDAEVEGEDSKRGSKLTRLIARKYYPKIALTIGYSPQDTPRAVRPNLMQDVGGYDVVFVDGLHTDEQQLKDFRGFVPFLSKKTVIVFHDVGLTNMRESFSAIAKEARTLGFDTFIETEESTAFGLGIVSRGIDSLKDYLDSFPAFVDRRIWNGKTVENEMLSEWFWRVDKDKNGKLEKKEYLEDNKGTSDGERHFNAMLERADRDKNGSLTVAECRGAFAFLSSPEVATAEFKKKDADRDGFVTVEEFASCPFSQCAKRRGRDAELLLKLKEMGGDRKLSLEEFLRIFAGKEQ